MIVLILICVGFYNLAKRKKLSPILWAVIGAVSYIGGQVLALLMFSELDEYSLNGGAAIGISLVGGVAAVLIAWLVLTNVASKKKNYEIIENSDLLDNEQYLENL